MKAFAILLDRLSYTSSRNGKLTLLRNYFLATPDPDRGYALAALTDTMPLNIPLRRVLTDLSGSRFDPVLFKLSRDYVGDTAETLALIWPETSSSEFAPRLHEIVAVLASTPRDRIAGQIAAWLDQSNAVERWALLKFLSGAPRVGVSARLAKQSLAEAYPQSIEDIEELWHGLKPPYLDLFSWLAGDADRPQNAAIPTFKPLMLANPLEAADWESLSLDDYAYEWKWDGIRVQFSGRGGVVRLFSRSGDDIGAAFPELLENQDLNAVLDGELLVKRGPDIAPFSDLQQRLNRKAVKPAMLADYPAHIRLYDALELDGEDLRSLAFDQRRMRLEIWHARSAPHHTDLSPIVRPGSKEELQAIWQSTRQAGIEGLMIKLRESPYLQGRPQGKWYKWKRTALTADCVLMYAQRGSGKRSSYYSDYTFGVWTDENNKRVLVPVGKAYSGFTDEELLKIDRFVRDNTVQQFGPVRAVAQKLVFEVAFDALNKSKRHKSGIAMRFPRIARIRWDKPAAEADLLSTLVKHAE
jgi:DNA ligase 1